MYILWIPTSKNQRRSSLRRIRSGLLSLVLILTAVLAAAKQIFDYSAAPEKDKNSDFVFPDDEEQKKGIDPDVLVKDLPVTFRQLGGFTNDASHLNKTAIYGSVRVSSEEDIRKALQFARDHHLKVTCAGQQHSMGGQTFTHDGLILDLRCLDDERAFVANLTALRVAGT